MNDCLAYKHKYNKYDLIVREKSLNEIFCLLKLGACIGV